MKYTHCIICKVKLPFVKNHSRGKACLEHRYDLIERNRREYERRKSDFITNEGEDLSKIGIGV